MSNPDQVVVIGSGPSGAAAATTLVAHGIKTLLLESGREFQRGLVVRAGGQNVFRRWPRYSEPPPTFQISGHPDTQWHALLAPGGLSNFWTAAVPRFHPEDFHEGGRIDHRYKWPVSYEELLPYYERVERWLHVSGDPNGGGAVPPSTVAVQRKLAPGWLALRESAERLGQGLIPVPLADGPSWLLRRTGAAFNSFTALVAPLQRESRFSLRLGAHVTRLIFDGDARAVRGVELVDTQTGDREEVQARAVVLAAGPLNSTRLLLASTSAEYPAGLGNRHDVLGRYLHDHPKDWLVLEFEKPMAVARPTTYLTRAPYAESPPLEATSITFSGIGKMGRGASVLRIPSRRYGAVTFGTMIPSRENCVRLDPTERDSVGESVLDLNIRYGDEVERAQAAARQRLQVIAGAAGNPVKIKWRMPELIPGLAAHYGGGVRLHADPQFGMLDGWNRLHEVPNVLVVDASSFTTGPEKNPTLTAMALAVRASSRLASEICRDAPLETI